MVDWLQPDWILHGLNPPIQPQTGKTSLKITPIMCLYFTGLSLWSSLQYHLSRDFFYETSQLWCQTELGDRKEGERRKRNWIFQGEKEEGEKERRKKRGKMERRERGGRKRKTNWTFEKWAEMCPQARERNWSCWCWWLQSKSFIAHLEYFSILN